ncbi:MAG: hypothetical protein C5B55_01980 [Blastocatellia bacterium]|nr:MAG: hypothetical protein C5B55_01980 [Blastocatellia bacterium]
MATTPLTHRRVYDRRFYITVLLLSTVTASAQTGAPTKITKTRVDVQGQYGPLFITIAGREQKIANQAEEAWITNNGRTVVYSAPDGAGGFENEGQSLYIYDTRTRKRKKILFEYYGVLNVEEVVTSQKKTALLVTMGDGGLGANYIAVVDPLRGEVFFRRFARILSHTNDEMTLGFYKEQDWDQLNDNGGNKVKPYKTEQHNLNSILKGRVIFNKRDR